MKIFVSIFALCLFSLTAQAKTVSVNPVCVEPPKLGSPCSEENNGWFVDGWTKGTCSDGKVHAVLCVQCFDPTVTFVKCNDGLVFDGWIQGNCPDGTVKTFSCTDKK